MAAVWSGALTVRSSACAPSAATMTSRDEGIPIRSTLPESSREGRADAANSANLRLDEPQLIVKMHDFSNRGAAVRLDLGCISMLCSDMAAVRSQESLLCMSVTVGQVSPGRVSTTTRS